MIVECSSEGVQLADPLDFRRFKLVLKVGASFEARSWQGIAFLDDHNALVSIDLVRALRGRPDDKAWAPAFAEMVGKARSHGWIDTETQAICAHVEREL
jgi:hypothetical protein